MRHEEEAAAVSGESGRRNTDRREREMPGTNKKDADVFREQRRRSGLKAR